MTLEAEHPLHACLSARESQVLCLLAAGKRITTIAAELGVKAKTVSTYRSRVLDKMLLQSTADLIQYAIRHGLVVYLLIGAFFQSYFQPVSQIPSC
jgi:DNA-binding NarL/FixJ family response regulator